MKYLRNLFSPLSRFKSCPIGAFAAVLLAATTTHGQVIAPSYTPGSVINRKVSSVLESGESDAFELEDWVPPATNAQPVTPDWNPPATNVQSSPSDWVPPATDATPFPPLSQEPEVQIEAPSIDPISEDHLLIQPPEAEPEPSLPPQLPSQAPSDQTLVPFSDIEQSAVSPAEPVPSQTALDETYETAPEVSTSPEIPPAANLSGDELIEFDSDCLECEGAVAGGPVEAGTVIGCDCGLAGCKKCGIAGRSIVNANIGARAAAVGRGAVNRTLGVGSNILGKVHSGGLQQSEPQLFTPVRNVLGTLNHGLAGNESVHAVGHLSFLSLSRDYRGRGRQLSSGGPNLFANGPDEGNFTGVDIGYGRRRSNGRGWEMRYIGFDPGQASDVSGGASLVYGGFAPPLNDPAIFGGALNPNIPQTFGLSAIGLNGFSAADVFGSALNHRVTRDSEFGSFEFNVLRATSGSTQASIGGAVVEVFAGLRGVSFQETTTFSAAAIQQPFFPTSALYASEVENSLFGVQIGGRLERGLGNGWGFTFGTRVGIYNNRVESRQRSEFTFADGSRATPSLLFGENQGEAFDFEGTDNELAFLGELDFGVTYQFRQFTRAKVGFRGIAVTNVATAAGQFEDSLFDVDAVSSPEAFGDLIVGGLYFGVDHAF